MIIGNMELLASYSDEGWAPSLSLTLRHDTLRPPPPPNFTGISTPSVLRNI